MDTEESCGSNSSERNRQQHFPSKNKQFSESLNKSKSSTPKMTEKHLEEMFENEDTLRYYLGLKQAVIESRSRGEICWCDPRDMQMKENLEQSGWKPRIILKLVGGKYNSQLEEFGLLGRQIALDENGQGDDLDSETLADSRQETECKDCGTEKSDNKSFICGLYGCNQTFTSLASYESHYHTCHNHVCSECKSSFVSDFLLDIHLQENHDSYFQILSPRIDMFRCLVPGCELKFRTPDLRKDHLVRVHKLPANFMFHKPLKNKAQKLKTKVKSTSSVSLTQSLSPSHDMELDDGREPVHEADGDTKISGRGREGTRGRHKKVPQTVCFGRGSQRAFQNRRPRGRMPHWHQMGAVDMDTTVDIEKVDFTDIIDSLECT